MSVERILAAIVAQSKAVTFDEMDDEVVTFRDYTMTVYTAAGAFKGRYDPNAQIPGSIALIQPATAVYLLADNVIGIKVDWL